jgi:hypothetical protein
VARLDIDFARRPDGSFGMRRFGNDELTSISGMFHASQVQFIFIYLFIYFNRYLASAVNPLLCSRLEPHAGPVQPVP